MLFTNPQKAIDYALANSPAWIAFRKDQGWVVRQRVADFEKDEEVELSVFNGNVKPVPTENDYGEATLALIKLNAEIEALNKNTNF